MGKTATLTVVRKTLTDTLQKDGKPQKITAEKAGCIKEYSWKVYMGKVW